MAKQIAVFADVSNLFYSLKSKFGGRKLDYKKFMDFIASFGEIKVAKAYGAQNKNEAQNFIYSLKKLGFETEWKKTKTYINKTSFNRKADWDVGMAVDMIIQSTRVDMMFLGSADGDMLPAIKYVKQMGVEVVVLASGISRELAEEIETIEIAKSLLEGE